MGNTGHNNTTLSAPGGVGGYKIDLADDRNFGLSFGFDENGKKNIQRLMDIPDAQFNPTEKTVAAVSGKFAGVGFTFSKRRVGFQPTIVPTAQYHPAPTRPAPARRFPCPPQPACNLFIDEGFTGLRPGDMVTLRVDGAGEDDLWARLTQAGRR